MWIYTAAVRSPLHIARKGTDVKNVRTGSVRSALDAPIFTADNTRAIQCDGQHRVCRNPCTSVRRNCGDKRDSAKLVYA